MAGVGGTRQCDWWFTDQAVFIDTAGRYTTQDSHAASDAREWQTFLQLLRRYRPVQPINGVIVTVSVPDLLQGGAELEQQAVAVDRRLQELRERLGQPFPVYLLVTKADLLAGFVEFFDPLDARERGFEGLLPRQAGVERLGLAGDELVPQAPLLQAVEVEGLVVFAGRVVDVEIHMQALAKEGLDRVAQESSQLGDAQGLAAARRGQLRRAAVRPPLRAVAR